MTITKSLKQINISAPSLFACLTLITLLSSSVFAASPLPYTIVDTGQIRCYDNTTETTFPKPAQPFFGQDAHYLGNQPAYKDNRDGTITDLNTHLMWTQNPGSKKTFAQAMAGASKCKVARYNDWRLPTIKELYSLILFSGTDPDPMSQNTSKQKPFLDTKYFKFQYGNQADGDRIIDSQFATSTIYRGTTMGGNKTMFGVNFADGRIKGYPAGSTRGRREKTYYVLYVRGNTNYGKNNFKDNGDNTITDAATGLTWTKVDSGHLKAGKRRDGKLNWQQGLEWAENLEYADHTDWRLPTAKELQSIVDYSKSPSATRSAAIDPIFQTTSIISEGRTKDYPYYWTSTTHASTTRASTAAYIPFGRALGWMQNRRTGNHTLMDVHGAGSQRSDPKSGDASRFPHGRGPQGDVIRIDNFVRCVRGGIANPQSAGPKPEMKQSSRQRQMQRPGQSSQNMSRQQGPTPQDFIRRLDKNGDGKVSSREFDGPARHFRQLDKNRDGQLSANEVPKGPPPQRGARNRR